jgi:hypothetical protein
MLVRAAVLAASIFMAGNALAADYTDHAGAEHRQPQGAEPVRFDRFATIARGQPARPAQLVLAPLSFSNFGDVEGGRGPNMNARDLTNIAVAMSIGNRDAVEIGSRQLRKLGVTREAMQDAIDRTKLHGDPLAEPLFGQSRIETDNNSVWVVSY